ncbi:hypothetical protein SAY86_016723 [Trapa natans]|uniref:Uncharacterized protein n=1 Tax=Trapa natans TaxID=22666 RepID=A0AAN7LAV5_TRANT|nr:hypothetical protein SAY86_016723 [Trapa natans]
MGRVRKESSADEHTEGKDGALAGKYEDEGGEELSQGGSDGVWVAGLMDVPEPVSTNRVRPHARYIKLNSIRSERFKLQRLKLQPRMKMEGSEKFAWRMVVKLAK